MVETLIVLVAVFPFAAAFIYLLHRPIDPAQAPWFYETDGGGGGGDGGSSGCGGGGDGGGE